jgi:hypothetical protein
MISRIFDVLLALLIGLGAFHVGWQVSEWIGRGLTIAGVMP